MVNVGHTRETYTKAMWDQHNELISQAHQEANDISMKADMLLNQGDDRGYGELVDEVIQEGRYDIEEINYKGEKCLKINNMLLILDIQKGNFERFSSELQGDVRLPSFNELKKEIFNQSNIAFLYKKYPDIFGDNEGFFCAEGELDPEHRYRDNARYGWAPHIGGCVYSIDGEPIDSNIGNIQSVKGNIDYVPKKLYVI